MCGIVCIIGRESQVLSESALKKLKHRGNDSSTIITSENYSIGFNRLAINDKSEKGKQPHEYKNLIGVFNGEIYNEEKLKKEFDISTVSNSDTEVILPLFEKFGTSIIHYLDGFYSGIIFNKDTNQLFVLRDYLGKKPFFYGTGKDFEFIVSELKSITSIDSFQIVPKGFSEISSGKIRILESHKIQKASKKDLKRFIIEAVEKRIPKSEKQFGVFLSGGIDSSIIAKVVSNLADNVIYYTLGNAQTNDLKFVTTLVKQLGIESKLRIIELPDSMDLTDLINQVVYHTESYNPSIISNGLATFLLSRAAYKDGLKVVLSGDGADELFCGYPLSRNALDWFKKRKELIENMHFTELRRLDLASMANTIEIRCPFLDRMVYAASLDCNLKDLIIESDEELKGKKILREIFKNDLPKEILERNKMSFDVGSGIRKLVVESLADFKKTERMLLKTVLEKHFQSNILNENYFHTYPIFDNSIEKRGINHK